MGNIRIDAFKETSESTAEVEEVENTQEVDSNLVVIASMIDFLIAAIKEASDQHVAAILVSSVDKENDLMSRFVGYNSALKLLRTSEENNAQEKIEKEG